MRIDPFIPLAILAAAVFAQGCPLDAEENGGTIAYGSQQRTGPYLGQEPPGDTPREFAPGIIQAWHSGVTFSPDAKEIYWADASGVGDPRRILFVSMEDGRWTNPSPVSFSDQRFKDDCPVVSPDGTKMFFNSNRPLDEGGRPGGERIWFSTRSGTGWSRPEPLDPAVNSRALHWQVSVAANGNLYLGSEREPCFGKDDIFRAIPEQGVYSSVENIGSPPNTPYMECTPFVAPDESFIIVSFEDPEHGERGADLCVSYRGEDGSWSEFINLGANINCEDYEVCPSLSPDGEFLFFLRLSSSKKALYWADASIIEELRPGR